MTDIADFTFATIVLLCIAAMLAIPASNAGLISAACGAAIVGAAMLSGIIGAAIIAFVE